MSSPNHNGKDVTKPTAANAIILETWSQGFMVGALIIMAGELAINYNPICGP
jgi:hypothetical protein